MTEATYKVGGMTCGGCVRSVTAAIERAIPGIAVEVSLDGANARIQGEHDPGVVAKAIEDAGFDFGGPDA